MSKQDRQSARTVTDLTRRYKFGETFAEVMGFATDAQQSAADAEAYAKQAGEAVSNLDQSLDQDEIFNRLTNDGEVEGIYRKDGQIYINASYIMAGILNADLIKTGVLTSADGTVKIDLIKNEVTIETADDASFRGRLVLSATGIDGYGQNLVTGELEKTLNIMPGARSSESSRMATRIAAYSDAPLNISPSFGRELSLGDANGTLFLEGRTVKLMGKTVWWEDNGDGSYTLKGR